MCAPACSDVDAYRCLWLLWGYNLKANHSGIKGYVVARSTVFVGLVAKLPDFEKRDERLIVTYSARTCNLA